MALYRLRAVWSMPSGVLQDRAVWSWGVESAAIPDGAGLLAAIGAAWIHGASTGVRLQNNLQQGIRGHLVEVYPAAGGALLDAASATGLTYASGTQGPSQLAISVGAQVSSVRGDRPLGRTMYGPFQGSATTGAPRPSISLQSACLNFATEFHRQCASRGWTPVVLTAGGTGGVPIQSYVTDNAWNTMRTRQWERTAITTVVP